MNTFYAHIRGRLQLDLAALHKQEMLCWDSLQFDEQHPPTDVDKQLFDQAALFAGQGDDNALRELVAQQPKLQVPTQVTSFSPVAGIQTVDVRAIAQF